MLINRRRHADGGAGGHELNVVPLIDIVFFLLVFYVISTTFTKAAAVPVDRPSSARAQSVSGAVLTVAVTRSGVIQVGDRAVELTGLPGQVRSGLRDGQTRKVLVLADRAVPTGQLLAVMDACRSAGADSVQVAAERGR